MSPDEKVKMCPLSRAITNSENGRRLKGNARSHVVLSKEGRQIDLL
jgi:hypothetical protein